MSKDDIDKAWENRVLCSDESCIGIIGPDGRCKECGLPFEGELPADLATGAADDSVETSSASSQPSPEEHPSETEQVSAQDSAEDEWSKRTLCSDESCIGVIGPDGRCKECGKAYTGPPAD
jgi:hypothetical protein